MAQLRDRYSQHGFDDDGNDLNNPITKRLAKSLIEAVQQRVTLENAKTTGKNVLEGVGGAAIGTAKALGKISSALEKGTASNLGQAGLTMLGPVGYVLSRMIPTMGRWTRGIGGLTNGFGKLTTSEARQGDKQGQKESDAKAIKLFESYPTIKKLNAYIETEMSMVRDNVDLGKRFNAFLTFQEEEGKEDKKEQKEQTSWLKKMHIETQKNQKLIVGGVILAGLGIMGLVSWIKGKFGGKPSKPGSPYYDYSDTTAEVTSTFKTNKKEFQTGSFAKNLKKTSEYGMRKHPVTGEMKMHQGIDIGGASQGAPIRSLCDGKAYPRMQVAGVSGYQKYTRESMKDARKLAGYGRLVRVVVDPKVAEAIGYGGKEVVVQYSHLYSINVTEGQSVKKGTIIGTMGSSGIGTGVHVDISVWVNGQSVNPESIDWDVSGEKLKTSEAFIKLEGSAITSEEKKEQFETKAKNAAQRRGELTSEQRNKTLNQSDYSLGYWDSNNTQKTDSGNINTSSSVSTFGKTDGLFDSGNTIISAVANNTSGSGFNQPTTQTIMYQPQNQQQGSSIYSNYGFTAGSNLQNMASGNNKNSIGVFK